MQPQPDQVWWYFEALVSGEQESLAETKRSGLLSPGYVTTSGPLPLFSESIFNVVHLYNNISSFQGHHYITHSPPPNLVISVQYSQRAWQKRTPTPRGRRKLGARCSALVTVKVLYELSWNKPPDFKSMYSLTEEECQKCHCGWNCKYLFQMKFLSDIFEGLTKWGAVVTLT